MDAKTLLIAVLLAAVAVLGYLYYENSQPRPRHRHSGREDRSEVARTTA